MRPAVVVAAVHRRTALTDLPEFLTVPECAAFLGTSRGVIYDMVRRGELAGVRVGRLLRIPRSALTALAATNHA